VAIGRERAVNRVWYGRISMVGAGLER